MVKQVISGIIIGAVVLIGASVVLPDRVEVIKPGAVSGPNISGNFFSVGGREVYQVKKPLTTSTTTVCAIQNATGATSTLMAGGAVLNLAVSTTTVHRVVIAKGSTPYATTTWLGGLAPNVTTAANALGTYQTEATTTKTSLDKYVFAPGEWVVMSMQGGVGNFSPSGTCAAEFVVL